MEQLYRANDVCAIFKISPRTLRRWIAAGNFPPPLRIHPNANDHWTRTVINEVIGAMPIADAYKNSTYHGNRAQCA